MNLGRSAVGNNRLRELGCSPGDNRVEGEIPSLPANTKKKETSDMTEEELELILEEAGTCNLEGCNIRLGLNIIAEYLPERGVEAAEHDMIYSAEVEEIIEAGLTVEDAKKLRDLNWMISEEALAHFV